MPFPRIAAAALLTLITAAQAAPATPERAAPYRDDRLLVKFKPGRTAAQIDGALRSRGAASWHAFRRPPRARAAAIDRWRVVDVGSRDALEATVRELRRDAAVERVELDYRYKHQAMPNDPRLGELWGLHNVGQTGGAFDADIDAPEAWNVSTGSASVVVAVIDTGIDYTHPDLAANMWTNPGEIAGNGLDDDGNGFVDDIHGYDFVQGDGDPMDDNSHGTHCAGTIAAVGNNGVGVVGVSWSAKLMAVKFLDAGGWGTTSDAVDAVLYATAMGARVMSNSWGGGGESQALRDAIVAARDQGALFVAAAGNGASDNDSFPNYPSNYDVENVVAVAATDHNDARASFSNWGTATVHLAAPGQDVLSTVPLAHDPSGYASFSGTSMATPHVAGAAAVVLAAYPGISLTQLKDRLVLSTDVKPSLQVASRGRLNIAASLESDSVPPAAVGDLQAMPMGAYALHLTWTATGDDAYVGQTRRYEIRYSTAPITDANFGSASRVPAPPPPTTSGGPQVLTLLGLEPSATYYVALRAFDNVGNASPLSNVAVGATEPEAVAFSTDFEGGLGGWAITGTDGKGGPSLWHLSPHRTSSPSNALYYGVESTLTYSTEAANHGEATSPTIPLACLAHPELRFQTFLQTEGAPPGFDITSAKVLVKVDGLADWTEVERSRDTSAMATKRVDLGPYAGKAVRVRFEFRSNVFFISGYEGWVIDDMKVGGAPVADGAPRAYTGGPYSALPGQAIQFTGSHSVDCGGGPLSYAWSFGDGTTAAVANPTHAYGPGQYTVTLTVTDGDGGTDTATTTVTIGPPPHEVVWKNLVWAWPDGNDLAKTAPSEAYDSGAISTKAIPSGDGFVEFTTGAPGYMAVGLGVGDSSQHYTDIDFAFFFRLNGTFSIMEAGVVLAPGGGSYAAGDVFRVEILGGIVRYRRNGVLLYSSSRAPAYPLVLDTALYTPAVAVRNAGIGAYAFTPTPPLAHAGGPDAAGTFEPIVFDGGASTDADGNILTYFWEFGDGATWTSSAPQAPHSYSAPGTYIVTLTVVDDEGLADTDSRSVTVIPAPMPIPVAWKNVVGALATFNLLTKSQDSEAYDAGAISAKSIPSGDGFVEFTGSGSGYAAVGLGVGHRSQHYSDIDTGFLLRSNGTYSILERGTVLPVGGGSYQQSTFGFTSRFRVEIVGGTIRYKVDGVVRHTSAMAPLYPLVVDTALYSRGITLVAQMGAFSLTQEPPTAEAGGPYSGQPAESILLDGAASTDPDGAIWYYLWDFGDGTSSAGPPSVSHAYAAAGTYTATLTVWDSDSLSDVDTATVTVTAAPPPIAVVWTNRVRASATGSTLTKTGTEAAYDAGAVSQKSFPSGGGYVEFTAGAPAYLAAGLGHGDSSQHYDDIDFAFFLRANGSFSAMQSGAIVPNCGGPYISGDVFRVEISSDGSLVRYKRGGVQVCAVSVTPPSYPLLFDTALYSPGAVVANATIAAFSMSNDAPVADAGGPYFRTPDLAVHFDASGSFDPDGTIASYLWDFGDGFTSTGPDPWHQYPGPGTYTATLTVTDAQGLTASDTAAVTIRVPPTTFFVRWTNRVGVMLQSGGLIKSGTQPAYDAGAISDRSIPFGDGFVEWGVTQYGYMAAGLGVGDSSQHYDDIDFAFFTRPDGTFSIMEKGALLPGVGGTYVPGSVFTVEIAGGLVRYKCNETIVHTSLRAPAYPLVLDTALYSPGVRVQDARIGAEAFPPEPPVADTGGPYSGMPGLAVQLTANSYDPDGFIVSYSWDFGDGSSGTGVQVSHAYASLGTYTVTLTVTDNEGSTDTDTTTVTIAPPPAPVIVAWKNLVQVALAGNELMKTGGNQAYDAGASSTQTIASGDGFLFFMPWSYGYMAVGLGVGDSSQHYDDIDFAFFFRANGSYSIMEKGVVLPSGGGTYTTGGDQFRIEIVGGTVRYLKNFVVVHTSSQAPAYPLGADTTFYTPGAQIKDAQITQ